MPKITLTVSLPKEIYHAIERLSALQGASKSALVVSVLEPALPSLTSMADLIEHLQNSTPEQRALIQDQILATGQAAQDALTDLNQAITPKE
ncbi:MAG TPA: hypothetical protein VL020_01930 [Pseudomonadales bacterium]|nr:hypothetical protein [Pseudomonadales bacterium]